MPKPPWWIISALRQRTNDEALNAELFKDSLDQQLLQWSLVSGLMDRSSSPRWWCVDSLVLDSPSDSDDLVHRVKSFIYNPLQIHKPETEPNIGGRILAGNLNVLVVGDIRDQLTREYLACLGRMLEIKRQDIFPVSTIRRIAIIYLPQNLAELEGNKEAAKFLTDLTTMMEPQQGGGRAFESVLILQDNNTSLDNPRGFSVLSQEQLLQAFVQAVFHLMIGGGKQLTTGQEMFGAKFFSVGSAALYYDWKQHQTELAEIAGKKLIEDFSNGSGPPFVNEKEAAHLAREVFAQLDFVNLFKSFALGENRPSFSFDSRIWEGARDRNGKLVSPWAALSQALLNVYFRVYIRFLPYRLAEYSRLFLTTKLKELRKYLKKRNDELWLESATGLKALIDEAVTEVLKGNGGTARSLSQVRKTLHLAIASCALKNLESELNNLDSFGRLRVFAVPKDLEEFHEAAAPELSFKEETKLHDSLAELLKRHPSPAALFIRSLLIGLMVALLGDRLLVFLSPKVVNLGWLLQIPFLDSVLLFLIPVALAFWRYQRWTLSEIRLRIRQYVGAILRHAQEQAKESIKQAMLEFGQRGISYCEELEKNVISLAGVIAYPDETAGSYHPSSFFCSLMGKIEIPGRGDATKVLQSVSPDYKVKVGGSGVFFRDCKPEQRNFLLKDMLNEQVHSEDKQLWEIFGESILSAEDQEMLGLGSLAIANYSKELYRDVQIQRLDTWLHMDDENHRKEIMERLYRLSSPAICIADGVPPEHVTAECLYYDVQRLRPLVNSLDVTLEQSEDGGVLSLAVYVPLQDLSAIANVYALRDEQDVVEFERNQVDPARIFALASTRPAGRRDADLKVISAINGSSYAIGDEHKPAIEKLRRLLGSAPQDDPLIQF
jgi:hypothetical protein